MKNLVLSHVLGLLCATAVCAEQAPSHSAAAVGNGDNPIHLLQFDVSGQGCLGRHCEMTLSDTNKMTAFPAVRAPGDRLYARIFDDTLANLEKPRNVRKGQCITYSTVRPELSNSKTDGSVVFGRQMRSQLFDYAKLSGSPGPVRTVVLVFETESGEESHSTTVLKLSADDVQKYFQYAVEVRFSMTPETFAELRNEMPLQSAGSTGAAAGSSSGGSGLAGLLASIVGWFAPPAHAASTGVSLPVSGTMAAISTEQIDLLLNPHCDAVTYVPAHTSYTVVSSLAPAAELESKPCGE